MKPIEEHSEPSRGNWEGGSGSAPPVQDAEINDLQALHAQLADVRAAYEKRIADLRKSIRYQIGDIVVKSVRQPSSVRDLPRRLLNLWRQAKARQRRKGAATQTSKAALTDLPPRRDISVAAILDEFSWLSLGPEARFMSLKPESWQEQVSTERPDLIFVESAWRGNGGAWSYAINKFESRNPNYLMDLLQWAAQEGVPSVFWNKEDPVNYAQFISAAREFSAILTTAEEAIKYYYSDAPTASVGVLPFAAQSRIHNPIGSRSNVRDRVAFAGAWRGDKYPHRGREFEIVLDPAFELGVLDIYDRYADHPDAGSLGFPNRYGPAVRGSLEYNQMVYEYRNYAGFLNVNSVQESKTMFSRRVFEILACGTPVVSSPSVGIEQLLGEHVVMVDTPSDTRSIVEELVYDVESRQRRGHLGYRYVHKHHTYRTRFDDILTIAGIPGAQRAEPSVTVIAVSNRPEQLQHVVSSFAKQDYQRKDLIFVANSSKFIQEEITSALRGLKAQVLTINESATLADCLNEAIGIAGGEYIAKFDDDDDYGQYYLSDMMLTFEYSGAAVAGKKSYFAYLHKSDQSVLRFPGNEFCFTNRVVGGTLVFNRHATNGIRFRPVQRGTDSIFLRSCTDAGLKIFSGDRYNFVQHRYADVSRHTWQIKERDFQADAVRIRTGYATGTMFL